MSFNGKSPVSLLKELCDREKGVFMHEFLPYEPNATTFICVVNAFDVFAKGEGRTKQVAKHQACKTLLSQLLQLNRFVDKLSTIPSISQISANSDATDTSIEIGPQSDLMFARSKVHQTSDTSTKIKDIKQIVSHAAPSIVQNDLQNKSQSPSTPLVSDPPENLFNTYHKLRTPTIQSTPLTLHNRHNFFLRLPEENQIRAREILLDQSGIFGTTNKDKVNLTCKALELRYKFQNSGKRQSNYKIFSLQGDYDCVLMGKIPDLYDRIVDYFKTMLNIQSY